MPKIPNIKLAEEIILVIGSIGSDADHTVLTTRGPLHVPGNNPETRKALEGMRENYAKLQQIALKEITGEQAGR